METITDISVYDRSLELFENQYPTPEGISYNSYIVNAGATAVLNTVDTRGSKEWRSYIEDYFGNENAPDYLVVQHLEPDHSAEIDWLMERYPRCRLVCSVPAKRFLPMLTDTYETYRDRVVTMADGQTLDLDGSTLTFLSAPMVHWPEVMMCIDSASRTLFSADAFGRFGDPAADLPWDSEARRYYYNVVGKYGAPVNKILDKLAKYDFTSIAPLHGPVLRGDISRHVALYRKWASYSSEKEGVMIAHASIHGNTAKAAEVLAGIFRENNIEVGMVDLCHFEQSQAVSLAFEFSELVLMASTYDGDVFPPMHDFIHHLRLKGYSNRKVGIVENGLWAPLAAKVMTEMLGQMQGIEIIQPVITVHGRLSEDNILQMRDLVANLRNSGEERGDRS